MATTCSSEGAQNDIDNHSTMDENDDDTIWGINISSLLEDIDGITDDDSGGSDDDSVDFITCFDDAILQITPLLRYSMQRFVRTKEYARFIKHFLKKKKDSVKQNEVNNHDTYHIGFFIDGGRRDDSHDNVHDGIGEQQKFYLDFIEPTRMFEKLFVVRDTGES